MTTIEDTTNTNIQIIDDKDNKDNKNNIYSQMKTGDIILFNGYHSFISSIIDWFTASKYSHIGIVLKDPTYIKPDLKGLFLLESGYEPVPDSINHNRKFGVQITNLKQKINDYDGLVIWRKLEAHISKMDDKMDIIYQTIKDCPYDLNIIDFLETKNNVFIPEKQYFSAILNWLRPNHRKTDTFFCSALVAYIYTGLGLFPKDTQWTRCLPNFFSEDNPTLKLLHGKLGNQVIIKQ